MSKIKYQIVIVLAVLLTGSFPLLWTGPANTSVDVTIPRGASLHDIAVLLTQKGVITTPQLFALVVKLQRAELALRAGEYRFPPHPSIPEVVAWLNRGPRDIERMVRVPEGLTIRELAALLEREVHISATQILTVVNHPSEQLVSRFPWLPAQTRQAGLEGYLLGDTYEVLQDSKPEEVVAMMLLNFQRKALPALAKAPARYPLDLHETVALASIVESEVATWQDRRIVADMFLRRLRRGGALQADSTVNYATGKNRSRVSFEDLASTSPYNTYRYPGLPPGPIANPSLLSLWAVIQPIPNSYWYFLTDRAGNVYYSQTFEEHAAKKAGIYGR